MRAAGRPSATLAILLLMGAAAPVMLRAQFQDPLTPAEAEQVRDTAGRLDKRVMLLLQFAQERLTEFEQVRTASPRPPGRDAELYSILRQYNTILPELDDAVDDLSSGETTSETQDTKVDIPKVLTPLVEGERGLLTKLQKIQSVSTASDLANYHFELQTCIDTTNDSLQDAQESVAAAVKAKQDKQGKKK